LSHRDILCDTICDTFCDILCNTICDTYVATLRHFHVYTHIHIAWLQFPHFKAYVPIYIAWHANHFSLIDV